jgi:aconitate hydratase
VGGIEAEAAMLGQSGMGILPLQFISGEDVDTFKLDGTEQFSIEAVGAKQKQAKVYLTRDNGTKFSFDTDIRIDTPNEFEYFRQGGGFCNM